jgi:hypothetical protein
MSAVEDVQGGARRNFEVEGKLQPVRPPRKCEDICSSCRGYFVLKWIQMVRSADESHCVQYYN